MSVFELLMLLCFGASWPFNLAKSIKTRSTKGKSPIFLSLIAVGYVFGIIHKMIYRPDIVIAAYALNLLMVSADLALYFVNRARERREGA